MFFKLLIIKIKLCIRVAEQITIFSIKKKKWMLLLTIKCLMFPLTRKRNEIDLLKWEMMKFLLNIIWLLNKKLFMIYIKNIFIERRINGSQ